MQRVYEVDDLPGDGLAACAAIHAHNLAPAQRLLEDDAASALAIVLPSAGPNHDDWRTALARDLARAHAPLRVNVVAGHTGPDREAILTYLADAPGVTGQYLAAHA